MCSACHRVLWLTDLKTAMWALVIVDVWQWTPFIMLIALAGLSAVPKYLYEAAEVDRASGWFKFRHITLPLVTPLLLIAILFRTMDAYKMFDQAYALTGGGPGGSTQVLSIYLYQMAFRDFNTGKGSALGYIMLIVIIALANLLIRVLNRPEGGEGVGGRLWQLPMRKAARSRDLQGEQPDAPGQPRCRRREPGRRAAHRRRGVLLAGAGAAFVFFLFPLFWMLITSIKARSEVTLLPPRYVPFLDFQPVGDNYRSVFTKASELGTITTSAAEPARRDQRISRPTC